jgi:hypothetical protein
LLDYEVNTKRTYIGPTIVPQVWILHVIEYISEYVTDHVPEHTCGKRNNLDFKHFTKSLSYRAIAIWLLKHKSCCIGFNNVLRVTMSLNKSLIMSLSMSLTMSLSKSLTTSIYMTCIRMNTATTPSQFDIPRLTPCLSDCYISAISQLIKSPNTTITEHHRRSQLNHKNPNQALWTPKVPKLARTHACEPSPARRCLHCSLLLRNMLTSN